MTAKGKQAKIKLTFSGQAGAVAVTAKRLGDAADDTDFSERRIGLTEGVRIGPALRCLTPIRWFERYQRQLGLNQFDHFA